MVPQSTESDENMTRVPLSTLLLRARRDLERRASRSQRSVPYLYPITWSAEIRQGVGMEAVDKVAIGTSCSTRSERAMEASAATYFSTRMENRRYHSQAVR